MRCWVFGGCLAVAAAGGVYFVATGGRSSHCGPCVAPPARPADPPAAAPGTPPVVEVVDVAAALSRPAAPTDRPFVSFDEPPLAKPPAPAPDVIPASFAEPDGAKPDLRARFWALAYPPAEVAPMPRVVEPDRGPGPMPLALPDDPF